CSLNNHEPIVNIAAHVGGDVLLPCSCSDLQTTPGDLKWRKKDKDGWETVSTNHGRFQLSNVRGNVSLLISHLTVEDDGLYRCQPEHDVWNDFFLIVKAPAASSEPLPFVPFAVVCVIFLHIITAVVYRRTRGK
ncbi:polymeric immunoglobulin receptor-like isoform X1, partial [Clarias magur]